jgi:RHS repeat-associated protein
VVSYSYLYNNANQRVRARLADGSYWVYTYDSLGQVIGGNKYWPDDTPVAGQQFQYAFDNIGNRTSTGAGGDQNGQNLRSASYTANNLNQYTSRTVPGGVDIIGLGYATNTITVNGTTAYRKGEYFRQQLGVANGSAAVWTNISVTEANVATNTGNLFVAQTPEAFSYDADGNLLSDGRWNYSWDAENRLVAMSANTTVGPQTSLAFQYDWQGRRVLKQVWSNPTWQGTPTNSTAFVYDQWNLIAELNTLNASAAPALYRSCMWGLDLSGSEQAAGGVGGLLEINDPTNGVHFVAYDGNGNVAGLVSASNGASSAAYEYGPFGEVVRGTGAMAKAGTLRLSTKYEDDETGFLYCGYRYYSPSSGRWLSRDPDEEAGGDNAYACLGNDPQNYVDPDGLCKLVSGPYLYKNGESIATLDEPFAPFDTPYYDLAKFAAGLVTGNYPSVQFNVSVPTRTGPFTEKNKKAGGVKAGIVTYAGYLVFVAWEVYDPFGDCAVKLVEWGLTTFTDGYKQQGTSATGASKDAVRRAWRADQQDCTTTLIYVDAPGNVATARKFKVGGKRYDARGFTFALIQTTTLYDATTQADVSSKTWSVDFAVDKNGNFKQP